MTRTDLIGQRVALLLMGNKANGEEDWAVFAGTILERDGRMLFQHEKGSLELNDEWASQVRSAAPETRPILLGAEYVLPLTIGDVGAEEAAAWEKTGFKWPGS